MSSDDKRKLVLFGNIKKGLFILAFPIMINNLLQTMYSLADTFWVGKISRSSDLEVSAIGSVWPVNFSVLAFGIGLGIATTSIISQYIGSGDKEKAKFYASQIYVLANIVGIIFAIVGYIFVPDIIRLMKIEGQWYNLSLQYLRILFIETPLVFGFFIFSSMRQAQGDTITPMIFSIIAVLINIILDPIFILVFGLGVKGAAIATVISKIIIAPFVIRNIFFKKDGVYIIPKYMIMKLYSIKKILKIAIPASLGQVSASIGFVVLNAFIASYGVYTMSAFQVGNRITSLAMMPAMGLGTALATYIGQNIGNDNISRAKESFKTSIKLTLMIMIICLLFLLPMRGYIVDIFLDKEQSISLAKEYMIFVGLSIPFMGILQNLLGVFQGSGKTIFVLVLTLSRLWLLRIPMIVLFGEYTNFGSSGIWYAMVISNIIINVIGYIIYRSNIWISKII